MTIFPWIVTATGEQAGDDVAAVLLKQKQATRNQARSIKAGVAPFNAKSVTVERILPGGLFWVTVETRIGIWTFTVSRLGHETPPNLSPFKEQA